MQKVYDTDSHIRAVADLNIENGMEKFFSSPPERMVLVMTVYLEFQIYITPK